MAWNAGHVLWHVPKCQILISVKLVFYAPNDFALYVVQPSSVFDVNIDATHMLVFGQIGLIVLNRNILVNAEPHWHLEGPMTLRFQQNGYLPRPYAIELTLAPTT